MTVDSLVDSKYTTYYYFEPIISYMIINILLKNRVLTIFCNVKIYKVQIPVSPQKPL